MLLKSSRIVHFSKQTLPLHLVTSISFAWHRFARIKNVCSPRAYLVFGFRPLGLLKVLARTEFKLHLRLLKYLSLHTCPLACFLASAFLNAGASGWLQLVSAVQLPQHDNCSRSSFAAECVQVLLCRFYD